MEAYEQWNYVNEFSQLEYADELEKLYLKVIAEDAKLVERFKHFVLMTKAKRQAFLALKFSVSAEEVREDLKGIKDITSLLAFAYERMREVEKRGEKLEFGSIVDNDEGKNAKLKLLSSIISEYLKAEGEKPQVVRVIEEKIASIDSLKPKYVGPIWGQILLESERIEDIQAIFSLPIFSSNLGLNSEILKQSGAARLDVLRGKGKSAASKLLSLKVADAMLEALRQPTFTGLQKQDAALLLTALADIYPPGPHRNFYKALGDACMLCDEESEYAVILKGFADRKRLGCSNRHFPCFIDAATAIAKASYKAENDFFEEEKWKKFIKELQ